MATPRKPKTLIATRQTDRIMEYRLDVSDRPLVAYFSVDTDSFGSQTFNVFYYGPRVWGKENYRYEDNEYHRQFITADGAKHFLFGMFAEDYRDHWSKL